MPELPEVETIRQYLRRGRDGAPSLLGFEVGGADLLWERTLATPSPQEFEARLRGRRIQEIDRRGKFLILSLDPGALLFHLRMSGDMLVEPQDAPAAPHHRLLLNFTNGWRLAFNDTRKFGRAWLVDDPQQVVGGLGPEPLDPAFTADNFIERLRARRRQLKPLLLDQTFLAGLGNIYTDEALHLSRRHPLMQSDQVTDEQAASLFENIRAVLLQGIRQHGASIDWVYRGGDFQNSFRAYRRTGQPCPQCGTPIIRVVVGQRSTHICPTCQNQAG